MYGCVANVYVRNPDNIGDSDKMCHVNHGKYGIWEYIDDKTGMFAALGHYNCW